MTDKTWKSLVTAITGDSSISESLSNSGGDYSVVSNQVYVYDRFLDTFVAVENRFVTGREVDERLENWEVVKERYAIEQNDRILYRANLLVAKYGGTASLIGCGVLDEGRKFFAVIQTGHIDVPLMTNGVDRINSYIVIITSHDGSIPICYYNLDSLERNGTTYRVPASKESEFSLRKRHTPSDTDLNQEVLEAMHMRREWSAHLSTTIKRLFTPIGLHLEAEILEEFWPIKFASTDKKREHAEGVHDLIRSLRAKDDAITGYGRYGISLLNAINNYIDFHRKIPDHEAAQHALEVDNYSHRLKLKVTERLLATNGVQT